MIPHFVLFVSWIISVDLLYIYALVSLTNNPSSIKRRFIPYPLIMITLFLLSATGYASSDYLNYVRMMDELKDWMGLPWVEPVYSILAYILDYQNTTFRIVTFLIIYFILYNIIRVYSLNKNVTLSIYILVLFFSVTSLIRSTLCDVIFYLGVLPFFQKRNLWRFFLLISCCTIAYFFHKSAFILFFILAMSLIKFNTNIYKLSLWFFPIFVVISIIITNYIFTNYFEESVYSGTSTTNSSRSAVIARFISYIYWSILLIIGLIHTRKYLCSNNFMGYLSRMFFWFAYSGLILMFNPGSHYLFMRTFYHGCIPFLLIFSYVFIKGKTSTRRRMLIIFGFGVIQTHLSYYLMYTYFNQLLDLNKYIV